MLVHRALLLCCLLVPLWAEPTPAEPPADLQLFLLAGQSNMAGRGVVEAQDRVPHPRIWMLNTEGKWVPAIDPVQYDKPDIVGVGPGRSFALALVAADPDIHVGLIPAAHGGSPIATWKPGVWLDQTDDYPWDEAIRRTHLAQQHGTLRAILWHQGEADCHAGRSEHYAERLHDLIARFRAEFDDPELPFIAGQLGSWPGALSGEHRDRIDEAHRKLPEHVPHSALVSSDGLSPKTGDFYHFDAASARELGRRYAEAWLAMNRD